MAWQLCPFLLASYIIFACARRCFIQSQPVTLFREPIEWVDTTRYITWSLHIDQVRKRAAQRMGLLGPLLSRKSDLSIRNRVLLLKQLIRPMMDYACPAWGPLPYPCPEATGVTPCYWCPMVRKQQADTRGSGRSAVCQPHQSPDWELWLKVSWCGEPPSTATWQILTLTEGWPRCLMQKPRAAGSSRPVEVIACNGEVN